MPRQRKIQANKPPNPTFTSKSRTAETRGDCGPYSRAIEIISPTNAILPNLQPIPMPGMILGESRLPDDLEVLVDAAP
jgi:hypothetical protein